MEKSIVLALNLNKLIYLSCFKDNQQKQQISKSLKNLPNSSKPISATFYYFFTLKGALESLRSLLESLQYPAERKTIGSEKSIPLFGAFFGIRPTSRGWETDNFISPPGKYRNFATNLGY